MRMKSYMADILMVAAMMAPMPTTGRRRKYYDMPESVKCNDEQKRMFGQPVKLNKKQKAKRKKP